MLKLYKNINGELHYHEAWIEKENGIAIEHWGKVGTLGESKNHPLPKRFSEQKLLSSLLASAATSGFAPFDDERLSVLLVEYVIDGMGTKADLKKRHNLESRLNETLGWAGVGHCDGGSIGSGTMEVCCLVVDFGIAKAVIETDLATTEFANFSRIYDENA
jgi:hypothetical protein